MNKREKEICIDFIEVFESFQKRFSEIFAVLGNELVNLRCAILVVKGYSKDYRVQEDPDIEMAFSEEMSNYQDSLQNMKNKISTAKGELSKLVEKNGGLHSVRKPSELTQALIDLYQDTIDPISELIENIDNSIMRKQFDLFQTINVGGVNPSIASLEEINDTYTESLSNIGSASKFTKEGIRLKNLIKVTLDEIKEKFPVLDDDKAKADDDKPASTIETGEELTEDDDLLEENLDDLVEVLKESVGNVESEDIDPDKPSVDGEIELKTRRDGVFVKIIPPENGGSPITLVELKSVLKGNKIKLPTDERLQAIIDKKSTKFIKVVDWEADPKKDAKIKILLKEKDMKAYANIKAPRFSGKPIDDEDMKKALEENKIKYGLKKDTIEKLVKTPVYNKDVLIAVGKEPVKGDNAEFTYHFKTEVKKRPKVDKKGNADHKELNIIQNVKPDTLLLEKKAPKPGKPGITVRNEEVSAQYGDDKQLKAGEGCEFREGDTKIYSTISGHPVINEDTVYVSTLYEIEGDVNYETGNIKFDGSVLVKGSVADEFEIEATHDIEVIGNVYKARLNAGGNIVVHQGINGREEGEIIAGKSITSKYVENANLEAKENIIVTNNILHSNIKSGNEIKCLGKGLIAGGNITARTSIECKTLGSSANVHTVVILGVDDELNEKQNKIGVDIFEAKKYIMKAKDIMKKIQPKADNDNRIYARWLNIKSAGAEKLKELNKLKEDLEKIGEEIKDLNYKTYIKTKTTYPNIEIHIGKAKIKTNSIIDYPHKIHSVMNEIKFAKIDEDDIEGELSAD